LSVNISQHSLLMAILYHAYNHKQVKIKGTVTNISGDASLPVFRLRKALLRNGKTGTVINQEVRINKNLVTAKLDKIRGFHTGNLVNKFLYNRVIGKRHTERNNKYNSPQCTPDMG
jgi:hypothetical protein